MARTTADDLFALLPSLYLDQDAESGALRGLLEVIARELSVIDHGLDQLEDDQFAETVSAEAVAGLGQLIGYLPLPIATPSVSPRADLANTILYRRRKGTPLLLERLARDVTGWPATVEESFTVLAWTQHARHRRDGAGGTADLRRHRISDSIGTAFDRAARTPDARRITGTANRLHTELSVGGPGAPRPSVPGLAVRLFIDHPVAAEEVVLEPTKDDPHHFRFDLLGRDRPLFTRTREVVEDTPAQQRDLPWPLSRPALLDDLPWHYGLDGSLLLRWSGDEVVPPDRVHAADLSDVPGGWAYEPDPGHCAVDPVLGRVAVGTRSPFEPARRPPALIASTYDARPQVAGAGQGRSTAIDPEAPDVLVEREGDLAAACVAALAAAPVEAQSTTALVRGDALFAIGTSLPSKSNHTLTIVGASGTRPILRARGVVSVGAEKGSVTELEGVVVTGGPLVVQDAADLDPRVLRLTDCTLVPGLGVQVDGTPTHPKAASLVIRNPMAEAVLTRCIVGPIAAVEGARVTLVDCIVDAGVRTGVAFAAPVPVTDRPETTRLSHAIVGDGSGVGAELCIDRTTVFGRVHARALTASDTLFCGRMPEVPVAGWPAPLWIRRRQEGCIRFSWMPKGSRVPRRFECLDDAHMDLSPAFWSTRFDAPRYGLLHPTTHFAIRRGASDGGEIGASNRLNVTHRETNLSARLQEYLRFGLEAGFSYAHLHESELHNVWT